MRPRSKRSLEAAPAAEPEEGLASTAMIPYQSTPELDSVAADDIGDILEVCAAYCWKYYHIPGQRHPDSKVQI